MARITLLRQVSDRSFSQQDVILVRRLGHLLGAAVELILSGPSRYPSEEIFATNGLTRREIEVCRLAARGSRNAEIAHMLRISPATVATHLNRAFAKLNVRSRTELAIRLGPPVDEQDLDMDGLGADGLPSPPVGRIAG